MRPDSGRKKPDGTMESSELVHHGERPKSAVKQQSKMVSSNA
jgi:hypothetical protein